MKAVDTSGSRWSWSFGALLVTVMISASFVPVAVGTLGPFLRDEFDLTTVELGFMTTMVFIVAALAAPQAGKVADQLKGRMVLSAVFFASAASIVATAAAPVYALVLVSLVLSGVVQAISNPATNRLLSANLPIRRRGYLVGVKQSGVQIGTFVSGAALPAGAVAIGWRPSLALGALVPILGALATVFVIPTDIRELPAVKEQLPRADAFLYWLSVYAFFMGAAVSAVTAFLPLYAVDRVNLSAQVAGLVAGAVGLTASVGRVVWAGKVERVDQLGRPLTAIALLTLGALALIGSAQWLGPVTLWLGGVAAGASLMSWNSVANFAIVRDMPNATGRASGVMQSAFYGGFIVSPIAFALIVDLTGSYAGAWLLVGTGVAAAATTAGLRPRRPRILRRRRGDAWPS